MPEPKEATRSIKVYESDAQWLMEKRGAGTVPDLVRKLKEGHQG